MERLRDWAGAGHGREGDLYILLPHKYKGPLDIP